MHDHDDKIFLNFIAIIKRKQNKNSKKPNNENISISLTNPLHEIGRSH